MQKEPICGSESDGDYDAMSDQVIDDTMSTASLGCSRSSACAMLDGMEDRERGDPDVAGPAGEEVRRRERQELLQALVAQVRRQRPGLD